MQRSRVAVAVDLHFFGRQALGETDAFFQGLPNFFVVQRIARRVDQPAPVSDGDAAPGIQKTDEIWRPAFSRRCFALATDREPMQDELVGSLALFRAPVRA